MPDLHGPLKFPDGTVQITAAVSGAAGAATYLGGALPYYIPAGETVTVPINQVAVMATSCLNDGVLVVDGLIVEV